MMNVYHYGIRKGEYIKNKETEEVLLLDEGFFPPNCFAEVDYDNIRKIPFFYSLTDVEIHIYLCKNSSSSIFFNDYKLIFKDIDGKKIISTKCNRHDFISLKWTYYSSIKLPKLKYSSGNRLKFINEPKIIFEKLEEFNFDSELCFDIFKKISKSEKFSEIIFKGYSIKVTHFIEFFVYTMLKISHTKDKTGINYFLEILYEAIFKELSSREMKFITTGIEISRYDKKWFPKENYIRELITICSRLTFTKENKCLIFNFSYT